MSKGDRIFAGVLMGIFVLSLTFAAGPGAGMIALGFYGLIFLAGMFFEK